jgi:hypothetical protein
LKKLHDLFYHFLAHEVISLGSRIQMTVLTGLVATVADINL